jgi:hypothetical protein
MKDIDGVYKVELLGLHGWEDFSTAFIDDGQYRSASAHHFADGVYRVDGERFNMVGNLTQYADHSPLFGEKGSKGLPIVFNGAIGNGFIDGEVRVAGRNKHAHRFRLSKVPALN